ncbi:GPP34 family phosphoprotein [Saccharopolyspora sp. NPDC050642]|uniref:GPP34 family phosphoprotein n=1 Tax=Saccharopolyspora sp. NPDC050642 TaxID=3157099 RepID=UPI0033C12EC9
MALPARLSLPEEFVVLAHHGNGTVHDASQVVAGCAAAELAELAVRRRLLVRIRKSKKFGFDVYFPSDAAIRLLDASRTGLGWADALLAELAQGSAAEGGSVRLRRWVRRRGRAALALHRFALVERGLLRHEPGKGLAGIFCGERHCPDPAARGVLLAAVQSAIGQDRYDERMLLLCGLAQSADLELEVRPTVRQRLDHGRGIGAVAAFPEELRDTSVALDSAVPMSSKGG